MCVLLEFWQKTWAIPIMNPLSWFMIITSGIPDHYSIGIPDHYSMPEKKTVQLCSGAHQVRRTREHVTTHTHNVNGKIQTWQIFPNIVYSFYGKS